MGLRHHLLSFVLLLCVFFAPSAWSDKRIVLANGEWAPYQSEHLKHHGYVSRIVTEAFARVGYEVDYVFLPWKRGYESARVGKYQGTLVWSHTRDREQAFHFSEPVVKLGTAVFYMKDKPVTWSQPEDLGQYRIGGIIGYSYGMDSLEEQGIITIERIARDESNYRKLAKGRLDIVLEDSEVGMGHIRNFGLENELDIAPKMLSSRLYYLMISRQTPNGEQLIEDFNRGLHQLQQDGLVEQYREESRQGLYESK